MEAAKFLVEHDVVPDYGPGEHGIGEQKFLYFRDPVGLRYELNAGGIRNYVPDWETHFWSLEDGPNNSYRNETGIPGVHMVAIPPGRAGPGDGAVFDGGGRRQGLSRPKPGLSRPKPGRAEASPWPVSGLSTLGVSSGLDRCSTSPLDL